MVCIYTLDTVRAAEDEWKMRQYIALIHKEADSDYGISFPDLSGVISAGKTLDEARDMDAEVLALHLEGMAADGEAAPEPSSLEEIMKDALAEIIRLRADKAELNRIIQDRPVVIARTV